MALAFADGDRPVDAVITLGAVIRGETTHYEIVSGECARGVQDVQLSTRVPVAFGVLTVNTLEQALERSASDEDNKGREAATTRLRDGVGAPTGIAGFVVELRGRIESFDEHRGDGLLRSDRGEGLLLPLRGHRRRIAQRRRRARWCPARRSVGHLGHDEAREIVKTWPPKVDGGDYRRRGGDRRLLTGLHRGLAQQGQSAFERAMVASVMAKRYVARALMRCGGVGGGAER